MAIQKHFAGDNQVVFISVFLMSRCCRKKSLLFDLFTEVFNKVLNFTIFDGELVIYPKFHHPWVIYPDFTVHWQNT
jgi:hypothetical protein